MKKESEGGEGSIVGHALLSKRERWVQLTHDTYFMRRSAGASCSQINSWRSPWSQDRSLSCTWYQVEKELPGTKYSVLIYSSVPGYEYTHIVGGTNYLELG